MPEAISRSREFYRHIGILKIRSGVICYVWHTSSIT
jgi:hypothetical protein